MTHPFLALTDADVEEMLRTIGVASIDELFRDIPPGVRLGRGLELEPALSEQELSAHLTELAARNVDTTRELSFLGAGIYDHYVPAVVDAVLQRGEFLTAYTPYQPEMSQGVLQSIFEYQTAICELTGMDVSNASGYDGETVTADACFVAKHATGRTKIVVTEATNPQVRQVVKTYAPGFGLEVVEVPHRGGVDRPGRAAAGGRRRGGRDLPAAELLRLPRAGTRPRRGRERRRGAPGRACRPAVARRARGARAATAARSRSARDRPRGTSPRTAGRTTASSPRRRDFIRRMPGRIVGETVDAAGERGYVLTLQTREQHIRREKATSNITTNQTLLALGGLVYLTWLGPQGIRELGETCLSLAAYAKQRLQEVAGLELLFAEQATFKEFAVRVGRNAREVIRDARALGVHPGYALGRDYEGLDDVLLVAVTEKRTPAEIDRLAAVLAEVAR